MKRTLWFPLLVLVAVGCRTSTHTPEGVPLTNPEAVVTDVTGDDAWALPPAPVSTSVVGLLEGPPPAKGARSPISLTAPDGTGLELVSLDVRAALEDPLALTEMRLTFENPQDRVLEGQFKFMLPSGAAISRFAMKVNGEWQEAEVVEKQAARQAYEDFLHRRQDPALLEQAPGNEFAARVFPIPARGRKEIIVTYSQALGTYADYTIFLKGLGMLDTLAMRVTSAGVELPIFQAERRHFVPGGDFAIPTARFERRSGLRSANIMMARVVPLPVEKVPADPLSSAVFLVDTSASRALGLEEQTKLLGDLVAALPPASRISVLAFDQSTELVFEGEASAFGPAAMAKLLARGALGASNLGLALKDAAEHAKSRSDSPKRLVLLSDGVATVGVQDAASMAAQFEGMSGFPFRRIDAVVVGGLRDAKMLEKIVRGNLPEDGVVVDGKLELSAIKARLDRATRSKIDVKVEGATWSYPDRIDGIQPGDEVRIFAEVPGDKVPRISLGGAPSFVPALRRVSGPLLEREWAAAKIASLTESPPGGDKDAGRRAIIDLSRKHRVLSPFTAMLVLESDADYKRFDISRTAKVDILGVDNGAITVQQRSRDIGEAKLDDKNKREEPRPQGAAEAPRTTDVVSVPSSLPPVEVPSVPQPPEKPTEATTVLKEVEKDGRTNGAPSAPALAARPQDQAPQPVVPRPEPSVAFPDPPRPSIDRSNPFAYEPPATAQARIAAVQDAEPKGEPPYQGRFKGVMDTLAQGGKVKALSDAKAWQKSDPQDVLALVALGEANEAVGDKLAAARAYGSILELFSFRADSRRFAGERLERLGTPFAQSLAHDAFVGAAEQRPDHPASHRLLAYSLLRQGRYAEAFAAIEKGVNRKYPDGRFLGAARILREDMALIAAAWAAAEPAKRPEIEKRLSALGITWENEPSVRFVLVWETDANDVDFHIRDAKGGHAYYGHMDLPSGGSLYADVITGYGPECFAIRGPVSNRAYPYRLSAHYFARGPMGYGMGKLQIVEHDGKGGLAFDERPFVIQADHAMVDLGTVKGPLAVKKN
ncbi:MAG: VIT domain-containing protein [Polyangiaceae bacterium]